MNGEPWRYTCPRGHVTLNRRHWGGGVYCKQCSRLYDFVVDKKRSKRVKV